MSVDNDFSGKELNAVRRVIEKEIKWLKYKMSITTLRPGDESFANLIGTLTSAHTKTSAKIISTEAAK